MDHSSTSFFCDKGRYPRVSIRYSKDLHWPFTVTIDNDDSSSVACFVTDESDLIAFKNSVISAYNKYREERYNGSRRVE